MPTIIDHEGNNSTIQWYNCVAEIANCKVSRINEDYYRWMLMHNQDDYSSLDWFGIKGGTAAVRRAVELDGWAEGVEKGLNTIGAFEIPKLPCVRRKRIRSAQGHTLDIHQVYSGNLHRSWESTKKQVRHNEMAYKGHVNIIIDLAASGGVNAESMFWRGAVGCIMARALMSSGRHVRVIAVDATSRFIDTYDENYTEHVRRFGVPRGHNKLVVAVVLKEFNQPLDLNNLFACTALAGFYRHYSFKSSLCIPFKLSGGMGAPAPFEVDDIKYFLDDTTCIVIQNIWSQKQAESRLQRFKEDVERGNAD